MDVSEAIRTRRSIRKYKDTDIPEEHIQLMLEAAQRAPNAGNKEDWYFVVVRSAEVKEKIRQTIIDRLEEIAGWPEVKGKEEQVRAMRRGSTFICRAPVIFIFFGRPYESLTDEIYRERGMSYEEWAHRRGAMSVQSCAAAIENVCLAAHALGYGSCWVGPGAAGLEVKRMLSIEDPWDLVAYLPVGVPDHDPPMRPRRPLSEVYRVV